MGYRRSLSLRWTHRDYLTVGIIIVTVAFLSGTTLVLFAAGAHTTSTSDRYTDSIQTTKYESLSAARSNASTTDIVLPLAITSTDGPSRYVAGVPRDAPTMLKGASVSWQKARIPPPPDKNGIKGPVSTPTQQRFHGQSETVETIVTPYTENDSIFPQSWYVSDTTTVRTLGVTDALVIKSASEAEQSTKGSTPEVTSPGLFAFFTTGIQGMLQLFLYAIASGGLLILVIIYNITRMSVRDRLQTIRVIRATGGEPRQLLLLFGFRAGLLTAIGTIVGYIVGVGLTRGATIAATALGVPVTLKPTLTLSVLRIHGPMVVFLIVVGTLGGVAAAWPATRTSPTQLGITKTGGSSSTKQADQESASKLRALLTPTLLRWRAFIPAMATLTIFVTIVVLLGSLAGVLAPLASTSSGTISEPGVSHPMASRIDANYTTALRDKGITASPEIIVSQVRGDQPYLARGANYTAFAAVSDATLTKGRTPQSKHEAVIGEDLARTLDVQVGEQLLIGGTTSPAITSVTIVGTFRAPGLSDDQLIVPLATAHDLSTKPGVVHFIRTDKANINLSRFADSRPSAGNDIIVSGISVPEIVMRGEPFSVTVTVRNLAETEKTREFTAEFGSRSRNRSVTLAGGETRQIEVNLTATTTGPVPLKIGSQTRTIRVYEEPPLAEPSIPATVPPGAKPAVLIQTEADTPVSNARVEIDGVTARTNQQGIAVLQMPSQTGNYSLTVQAGSRTNSTQVRVAPGAPRRVTATVETTPTNMSVVAEPEVEATIYNPWNRRLTRSIAIETPARTVHETVTLSPHSETTITQNVTTNTSSERLTPGNYTVKVRSNDRTLARDTFTVYSTDQLLSQLAETTDYSRGTGIGNAVQSLLGNLKFVMGTIVFFAGLATIGGTVATFAQAVHARREALGVYRATGATRGRLLRLLLVDACRVSIPAIVGAFLISWCVLQGLVLLDQLVVFGVRVSLSFQPLFVLGIGVSALLLSCLGAGIASYPYLTTAPAKMRGRRNDSPKTESDSS